MIKYNTGDLISYIPKGSDTVHVCTFIEYAETNDEACWVKSGNITTIIYGSSIVVSIDQLNEHLDDLTYL